MPAPGRLGFTTISWHDKDTEVTISTTSGKLIESLACVGVRFTETTDGLWEATVPKKWLRLRVPKYGLVILGWYPAGYRKGVFNIMEARPPLELVKG